MCGKKEVIDKGGKTDEKERERKRREETANGEG